MDNLENTPIEVKVFQTKMKDIYSIREYDEAFSMKTENILQKTEEFQERDSGWTLVQLVKVELNLNKFQPLRGSTYIPLPTKLQLKKACINVQNQDEFCFKWAIILAIAKIKKNAMRTSQYKVNIYSNNIFINGVHLNFSGLSFPLKLKDINIFEINNPNISVNVFGYDEAKDLIVGPYYKSKEEKPKHINLLFIQANNGDNSHYVWIKHISRYVN